MNCGSGIESLRPLRDSEFGILDTDGHTYLDYTGSALAPQSLIASHARFLSERVLGNPHSENPPSRRSTRIIRDARARVLEFFDADPGEYTVCFTSNATAALKLVAESFPFTDRSQAVLTSDNHNSVNGFRRYADRAGAAVQYVGLDPSLRLDDNDLERALGGRVDGPSVFAFPVQSNFSGVHHPLDLIARAHDLGFKTVLDAAAFAPSNPLSLRVNTADFVCVSFYKMFGYPTGIGALIARQEALAILRRPWFSGGTVDFVSVQNGIESFIQGPEQFEDGTPNFQAIAAIETGLEFLRSIGMGAIQTHVKMLTKHLLDRLMAVRHDSGQRLVRLYGPESTDSRGGTVAFNLVDFRGDGVPYEVVEERAAAAGIAVRGGCFCNPGASEHAFSIPAAKGKECLEALSPSSFTPQQFSKCIGDAPVGAVRVSVGLANQERDIDQLMELLATFLDRASPRPLRHVA